MPRTCLIAFCLVLPACAGQPGIGTGGSIFGQAQPESAATAPAEARTTPLDATDRPPAQANTPEALDTTTEEERKEAMAAAQAAGGARALGASVASLGAVSEPGIWIKTPLVTAPARGRVDYPAKGTSVAVDLIPLNAPPGSGSRLSLAAMRLLEADLTSLPEVQVYQLP